MSVAEFVNAVDTGIATAYAKVSDGATAAKESFTQIVGPDIMESASENFDKASKAYHALVGFLGRTTEIAVLLGGAALLAYMLYHILRFCCSSSQPPDGPSATARHILVQDELFARELKKTFDGKKGERLFSWFSSAAAKHSDCWSGMSGGALGSFGPGKYGPAFDQAVWSGPLMEVQGPVQTDAGFHLVLVIQRSGHLPVDGAKKDS